MNNKRALAKPVYKNKKALEAVALRLGLTVVSARRYGDLALLGKILQDNGAVATGRGIYLLAAEHLVGAINTVAKITSQIEATSSQPNSKTSDESAGAASEELRAWLSLHRELISDLRQLGYDMIKSETILRDLPPPLTTNQSFQPGSIVGPVTVVLAQPQENRTDAIEIPSRR